MARSLLWGISLCTAVVRADEAVSGSTPNQVTEAVISSPHTSHALVLHWTGTETRASGTPHFSGGHRLPSTVTDRDDGIHASWSWTGETLTIETDRYGMYPLFHAVEGNTLRVATSVAALVAAGADTAFDLDALAVFLRVGFFMGDDTAFRAIRAVPPNATLRWSRGILTTEQRPVVPTWSDCTADAAVDGYLELFRAAMRRRPAPAGGFRLPLSGGRDSRHILLELCAAGTPPALCLCTTRDILNDADIAAQLAAAMGVPHQIVQERPWSVADERRNLELTHYCADEHTWYHAMLDELDVPGTTTYDGIAGDVLSQGGRSQKLRLEWFRAGDAETVAVHLVERDRSREDLRFLSPELCRGTTFDAAVARTAAEVRQHLDRPNPAASFMFWSRARRETALMPYGLLAGGPTVYAPYLDHALYDHLTSLPAELTVPMRMHDRVIERIAPPAAAAVPFAANRKPPLDLSSPSAALAALRTPGARRVLDVGYLVPRVARGFVSRRHAHELVWAKFPVLYMAELQRLRERGVSRQPPLADASVVDRPLADRPFAERPLADRPARATSDRSAIGRWTAPTEASPSHQPEPPATRPV